MYNSPFLTVYLKKKSYSKLTRNTCAWQLMQSLITSLKIAHALEVEVKYVSGLVTLVASARKASSSAKFLLRLLTLLTPSDHPLLVHRHHSNRQTPFEKVCRHRLSTRQQKQCYHHQLKALLSLCREYTIIIWLCTKTRGIRTTMVYYLNSVYCYGAMHVMIYLTGRSN